MKAVADGAAIDIDMGAGDEVRWVCLHVSANHFALDPAIEGHVDKLALMGKGWVIDGDGDLAVHEVDKDGEWNQNESDDQSKNEAHACLLPPPQEFIVEHEGAVGGKKLWGASKRSQSQ